MAGEKKTPPAKPSRAKPETPDSPAIRGVPAAPDTPVLRALIFIIEWKAAGDITRIFEEQHVRFHFICKGRGTANSEILDILGIGASEKAVVICLEQDMMAPLLIREVSQALGLYNLGAGIAFTIPLSGINKPVLQVFKNSVHKHISEKKPGSRRGKNEREDTVGAEKKYDLIVIIVNQGYSDELMAVARDVGATGGTILNARGLVHRGPVKFFGISVQDEREIITILAGRDKKVAIMRAVSESFGLNSKAKGLVFSLPAQDVTGLSQI
ncbi:MAG: hypothetical protein LBG84_03425 [Treponema sp.]|jgi:hypothetical protein|nr:hypothetical protein [Treponema sp.]